jgi:TRAP-type C4-dicarboxylate transport system permease small subunit
VLLCGVFMFFVGGQRVLRLMTLPGVQPMTGWPNWVQYISVPIAGFVMIYDCILFMTGVLKQDDLIYGEPEVDYAGQVEHSRKKLSKKENA